MFPPPTYPTPLTRCPELSGSDVELWIKNDGFTHPVYGGNKVRKAVRLIREAERRQARRIMTIGAVGSHHVLTMTLFAKTAGLRCAAVLIPQPRTEHVVETIRAAVGQGLEPLCTRWQVAVPFRLALGLERGDMFVPPGGSNVTGALAYADAVEELAAQLKVEGLAHPDVIVVPLGSGGTAAGIVAGVLKHGLRSRVIGVQVVPGLMTRVLARRLCRSTLRALGAGDRIGAVGGTFSIDTQQQGAGYGFETEAGREATAVAARFGLELEPTYTAKAFAAVQRLLKQPNSLGAAKSPKRILYWHTLSTAPLEPLLEKAPSEEELPLSVRRLLGSA